MTPTPPRTVLGLATMGTSAACLMRDGTLVAAIEEERLSRIKNDGAFPHRAIAECLAAGGITLAEVDAVAVYWRRWRLGTRVRGTLGKAVRSAEARRAIGRATRRALTGAATPARPEDAGGWSDLFAIRRILERDFGPCRAAIRFHDHHRTHQLYAEALRGWPACLSLSYDGGGEADSTVLSRVENGRRTELRRVKWPNSLGHFYSVFTGYLGFRMLEGEYKMMGLAPYGRPRLRDAILDRLLRLEKGGRYRLDTRLCDYHRALEGDFLPELAEIVGPPRAPEEEPTAAHLDLAASVQAAFEAAQTHLLAWGRAQAPGIDRLVLSGGCALNVTANGRLLQSGLFAEIAVPPAPHDAGCAIGAALAEAGQADVRAPYLGPEFSDTEIAEAFRSLGLPAPPPADADALIAAAVATLTAGGVVAWFQGRAEFGPRALGARSILADPRDDRIRETLNAKIKKRELFRPFAPSTTLEAAPDWFELAQASPYMNIVATVRPEKRPAIPAVTHVDGTARVHTVDRDMNPLYHRLITAFGAETGVPVLLNTSFNIQEPIVTTPAQAIATYLRSDMDLMAIGGFLADRAWRSAAEGRAEPLRPHGSGPDQSDGVGRAAAP
jgi:carbamoyltransferase